MFSTATLSLVEKARTVRGTHTEITDPHLRLILANELLVLRAIVQKAKKRGYPMDSSYIFGAQIGLDTAFRRIEDVRKNGIENVYAQNYPKRENKSET